jgi:hypothetical protein
MEFMYQEQNQQNERVQSFYQYIKKERGKIQMTERDRLIKYMPQNLSKNTKCKIKNVFISLFYIKPNMALEKYDLALIVPLLRKYC